MLCLFVWGFFSVFVLFDFLFVLFCVLCPMFPVCLDYSFSVAPIPFSLKSLTVLKGYNLNPLIEKGQKTKWPKEKGQNDKQ